MFIWKGAALELGGRVFYRSFAKSTAAKRSQCSTLSLLRCRHYIIKDALYGLPISYPTTQYFTLSSVTPIFQWAHPELSQTIRHWL